MERLREVLAFVNHKGGVGKTTTVQSLAAGLRLYGKGKFGVDADGRKRLPRVLIIDLDPQACASFLFGWSETQNVGKPTVYDAMVQQSNLPIYQVREGIYLAPAASRLISIEPFLNQRAVPRKVLYRLLAKPLNEMSGTELADEGLTTVTEAFDYVLIDCPPAMSLLITISKPRMSRSGFRSSRVSSMALMISAIPFVANTSSCTGNTTLVAAVSALYVSNDMAGGQSIST